MTFDLAKCECLIVNREKVKITSGISLPEGRVADMPWPELQISWNPAVIKQQWCGLMHSHLWVQNQRRRVLRNKLTSKNKLKQSTLALSKSSDTHSSDQLETRRPERNRHRNKEAHWRCMVCSILSWAQLDYSPAGKRKWTAQHRKCCVPKRAESQIICQQEIRKWPPDGWMQEPHSQWKKRLHCAWRKSLSIIADNGPAHINGSNHDSSRAVFQQ